MAENTVIPIIASKKSNGASQGIYDNRVKDNRDIFFEEGNSDWDKFKMNTGVWISNKKEWIFFYPIFMHTLGHPYSKYVDFTDWYSVMN